LLQVQEEFGAELISKDEVDLIHKLWAEDLQTEEGLANV
jgi:DNA sulfur modification protein DndC